MTQEYSNTARESDPFALPNIEVFFHPDDYNLNADPDPDSECYEKGFYYWYCFPGCMPDSDPIGPFESYDAALKDAREFESEDSE